MHGGWLFQLSRWIRAEEIGLWFRFGWSLFDCFYGEKVGVGCEVDGSDTTVNGDKKWRLGEGLSGGQVCHGSKGSKRVANAQEKVAVAEGPEVLAVIVRAPCRACEDMAGGNFEKDCVDGAILIVLGVVDQSPEKMTCTEGEKEMLVVNVVQRQHGAASEQELDGLRLKTKTFERDTQRRLRTTGRTDGNASQEKKRRQGPEASAQQRVGVLGNRHGSWRVSLLN